MEMIGYTQFMNNINTHIMRASGKLEPFLEIINDIQENYLPELCNKLSASDVDIIICDDASRAIPETGVGGWAFHPNLLSIYIDPESKNLAERLQSELKSTLAHELHHVTRWRLMGYQDTLLESIITDGLADHFDIDFNAGSPHPWDVALGDDELEKYLKEASLIWNNQGFDHGQWYLGTSGIPRWTGYALGFKLVNDYVMKTGDRDPKSLIRLPVTAFIT